MKRVLITLFIVADYVGWNPDAIAGNASNISDSSHTTTTRTQGEKQ